VERKYYVRFFEEFPNKNVTFQGPGKLNDQGKVGYFTTDSRINRKTFQMRRRKPGKLPCMGFAKRKHAIQILGIQHQCAVVRFLKLIRINCLTGIRGIIIK